MGFMAVPADGSCHMPCAGIAFRMSPSMGDFPSQRAAFEFCFPDVLLSRAGGCRGKTNTKKLMLSIFSEINFFNIYKAVLMHYLLTYTQIHSSKQPP